MWTSNPNSTCEMLINATTMLESWYYMSLYVVIFIIFYTVIILNVPVGNSYGLSIYNPHYRYTGTSTKIDFQIDAHSITSKLSGSYPIRSRADSINLKTCLSEPLVSGYVCLSIRSQNWKCKTYSDSIYFVFFYQFQKCVFVEHNLPHYAPVGCDGLLFDDVKTAHRKQNI